MNPNRATGNSTPKIAVIGPSQSGKTCLAVGLFSTSTPGFTIEAVDRDGRIYLDGLKAGLAQDKDKKGVWPAANIKGYRQEIRLDFQKPGKDPIRVAFPEYAGELLNTEEEFKDFANAHFRDLSGVVLLVNPGAKAFQSGQRELADAIAQYKRVIDFLKNPNNGSNEAFVALTVTAADRLVGDLQGKLEAFSQCVEEISNTLNTSGFKGKWKRFDVTITGHLEDQDNPRLARGKDNSASLPFLWILGKLKWIPIWRVVLRKIRFALIILAALGAFAGIFNAVKGYHDDKEIRIRLMELEKLLENNDASVLPTNEGLDAVRQAFAALGQPIEYKFRLVCAGLVIPDNDALSDAKRMMLPLYGSSRKLAQKKAVELEPRVWELFKRRIEHDIFDIKADAAVYATDYAILSVDKLFADFVPKFPPSKEAHETMLASWNQEKAGLHEQYAINTMIFAIGKPLDALSGRHGEEVPTMLFALYGELGKIRVLAGADKMAAKKEELALRLDARTAEEFRHLIKETFKMGLPDEQAKTAAKILTEMMSPWVPATDAWKSEKDAIQGEIEALTSETTRRWMAEQRKVCEDWVAAEVRNRKDRPLTGKNGLWDAYRQFARRNADNPFFTSIVQDEVYSLAEKTFSKDAAWFRAEGGGTAKLWSDKENFTANWKTVNDRFAEFRKLCREVADDKTPLRSSWAWHFAQRCINNGKIENQGKSFPRRIVIDWINAFANYNGKLPINYKCTSFGARIDVERFNGNGTRAEAESKEILPFASDGKNAKDDGGNSIKASKHKSKGKTDGSLLQKRMFVDVHAFEKVELVLVATDYNKVSWPLSSHLKRTVLAWGDKRIQNGAKGGLFDLSFHLKRWTGASHPELLMEIRGYVEDDNSIDALLEKAKQDAAAFKPDK